MIHKSSILNLKSFINSFDFPSPNWDSLPIGFPYLEKGGLTKEERHLLNAIILAWYATQSEGRRFLSRKLLQTGLFATICLISLIRLISGNQGEFTKTVNAATKTVNEVVESTMSAVLKGR